MPSLSLYLPATNARQQALEDSLASPKVRGGLQSPEDFRSQQQLPDRSRRQTGGRKVSVTTNGDPRGMLALPRRQIFLHHEVWPGSLGDLPQGCRSHFQLAPHSQL